MTTSRSVRAAFLLLVFALTTTVWGESVPSTWTWSIQPLRDLSPVATPGGWTVTLPKMLVKGWEQLASHRLSESERSTFTDKERESKVQDLKRQHDQKALERARLLLGVRVDPRELATLDRSLEKLETQWQKAAASGDESVDAGSDDVLVPLKAVDGLESTAAPVDALYVITGSLRSLSGYLQVVLTLSSRVEARELSRWEGTFAPEEAAAQMQLARQKFLEVLLGRPWAGLHIRSDVAGTVVEVGSRGRRSIPWLGEDLDPGPLTLKIYRPGRAVEVVETTLVPFTITPVDLAKPSTVGETIRVVTSPPDAAVWLDSRWLGHTPLDLEVPLQLSRLRYQLDGYAAGVIEVGPDSPRLLDLKLALPGPLADPTAKRDLFYWSLAALTATSTTTFFLRDGADQQLRLANAYAKGGNSATYTPAVNTLNVLWYGSQASIALTAGVFVWMMFTLGDYLSAAQSQLP